MKHYPTLAEFLAHSYQDLLALSCSITKLHGDRLTEFVHDFIAVRMPKLRILEKYNPDILAFNSYIYGHITFFWKDTLRRHYLAQERMKTGEYIDDVGYDSSKPDTPSTFVVRDCMMEKNSRSEGFVRMVKEGYTLREISAVCGVSKQRIHKCLGEVTVHFW